MRIIRNLVLLVIIVVIGFYVWEGNKSEFEGTIKTEVIEKMNVLQSKIAPDRSSQRIPLEGDLYTWIGKTEDALVQAFGEPVRKDLSAYDYQWWIYTDYGESYIQFGVEDEVIKTIYTVGADLAMDPIEIGQDYDTLQDKFNFEEEVHYTKGLASYTFKMTEDDLKRRPLVKVSDDVFLQFYFDTFTNQLSSLRVLEADVLLKHRPYEITYRGSLPDEPDLTEAQWEQIETGLEQQIFDISNVLRNRFDRSSLEWDEEVSEVAFNHSKDMNDNNYFSHYSQNGDGLKERFAVTGIFYIAAGENIAAQYPDAPSVVEGWLNSEGHREALLAEEYTHLGVGVYRFYYTQNFLAKPM